MDTIAVTTFWTMPDVAGGRVCPEAGTACQKLTGPVY